MSTYSVLIGKTYRLDRALIQAVSPPSISRCEAVRLVSILTKDPSINGIDALPSKGFIKFIPIDADRFTDGDQLIGAQIIIECTTADPITLLSL